MISKSVTWIYGWFIGARPWSWPASVTPVLFGTALAVVVEGAIFRSVLFVMSLIAMVFLHSGANLLSDARDLKKGLDKLGQVTPSTGAVARGLLTPKQAERGACVLFAIGAMLGLAIAFKAGPAIIWIGLIGLAIGALYPYLKYRAFGDFAVFADFGVLGTAGAWVVQTGSISITPVIWSIPIGLLIVAILHANNWRDIRSDRAGGIRTIASFLGDKGSFIYFSLLVTVPFLFMTAGVVLSRLGSGLSIGPSMPWSMLIVWIAFPMALVRILRASRRRAPGAKDSVRALEFVALDGATAQLSLVFGMLAVAGLLLSRSGIT